MPGATVPLSVPTAVEPSPGPPAAPVPQAAREQARYVRVGHKGMGVWSTREVRPRRRTGCMLWLPRLLLLLLLVLSLFWCGYEDSRARDRPGSGSTGGAAGFRDGAHARGP